MYIRRGSDNAESLLHMNVPCMAAVYASSGVAI